jgi:short-subunit dehydrogenase
MANQGFGHIVNTASLAGLISFPTGTPYSTTKFGVVGLSTSMRYEGATLGVKVSAVCPGFIQTGIYNAATYLKVNREDLLGQLPFKPVDASKSARAILHGVERNKAIITVPFLAHIVWWLGRLSPALIAPLQTKMIRDFRKIRKNY